MNKTNFNKKRINWDQVRARLEASQKALLEELTASPKRIEDAYQKRAIQIANVPVQFATASVPVLIFRLAQERYAVELKDLMEVLPLVWCAQVPGASAEFLGVTNRRGQLVAVVDLECCLMGSASKKSDAGFVLMLRRPGREIGLKVDSIEALMELHMENVSLSSEGKYVRGIASGKLILLDLEALLVEVFSQGERVSA